MDRADLQTSFDSEQAFLYRFLLRLKKLEYTYREEILQGSSCHP